MSSKTWKFAAAVFATAGSFALADWQDTDGGLHAALPSAANIGGKTVNGPSAADLGWTYAATVTNLQPVARPTNLVARETEYIAALAGLGLVPGATMEAKIAAIKSQYAKSASTTNGVYWGRVSITEIVMKEQAIRQDGGDPDSATGAATNYVPIVTRQ